MTGDGWNRNHKHRVLVDSRDSRIFFGSVEVKLPKNKRFRRMLTVNWYLKRPCTTSWRYNLRAVPKFRMFFSDIYKSSSVYISTSIHIIRPLSMCLPLRSQQNHPPKPSPCDRHWPIVLPHSREANTFPPRRRRSPPNLIFHSTSRWTTKLSRLHQLHISMNSGNLGHHFFSLQRKDLSDSTLRYTVLHRAASQDLYMVWGSQSWPSLT